MLKEDLEALTGKIIEGDLTPILISIIKESPHKKDLLKFCHYCSDKELVEALEEVAKLDSNKKSNPTPVKKTSSRPSLEDWISGRRSGMPL